MSNLKNRLHRLESQRGAKGVHYMWIEPEWSRSEIEACEVESRRERNIPDSVEVIAIGWHRDQENEGGQK